MVLVVFIVKKKLPKTSTHYFGKMVPSAGFNRKVTRTEMGKRGTNRQLLKHSYDKKKKTYFSNKLQHIKSQRLFLCFSFQYLLFNVLTDFFYSL